MGRYYISATPGVLAILMRHGSTNANNASKPLVRGWLDNTLAPKGQKEVAETAEKLRQYEPKYVYSSDFMRDSETAEIVCNVLGITGREVDYDARTWDVGAFSGKPEAEVNPSILDLYRRAGDRPPGSGESFNDFAARWIHFLEAKLNYAAQVPEQRPPIIVTHGRNLALTHAHYEGVNTWDADMPMPAGYALLVVNPDRSIDIKFQGETEKVCQDV